MTNYWGYSDPEKVRELTAIIKKYQGQFQLHKKAKEELEKAMKELAEIQDKCYHSFMDYTGLNQIDEICIRCDLKRVKKNDK